MRLSIGLAGALVLSLLYALPIGVRAQTIDTQVGNPLSGSGCLGCPFDQLIGLQTASGNKKAAVMVVQGPDPTKDGDKPRGAYFPDKAHWGEFVKLWNQARATHAPAKNTNIIDNSTKIGKYLDLGTQTMAFVSVNEDATIEIVVIGPDKWPMMFYLRPKDFDEFGQDVTTVSAYFGN
jgi:hypothetical protein